MTEILNMAIHTEWAGVPVLIWVCGSGLICGSALIGFFFWRYGYFHLVFTSKDRRIEVETSDAKNQNGGFKRLADKE